MASDTIPDTDARAFLSAFSAGFFGGDEEPMQEYLQARARQEPSRGRAPRRRPPSHQATQEAHRHVRQLVPDRP